MYQTINRAIRSLGQALQSPLLLLIRLYWGYHFLTAGTQKFLSLGATTDFFHSLNIPLPFVSALLVGAIEIIGGVCLILGLWSRLISIPLLAVMLTALSTVDHVAIASLINHMDPEPLFKAPPFLFTYALAIIFCFGPGKIALDHWMGNEPLA